ncbi:uncharacterized protein YALI1_C24531g [Yarrowia lipolytica]|uniref:Uncharacterized protein n=1 Tax=Yarrowia lipolytica TaxID=4952 RepID=A0A1D8NBI7_YARLL|nr:hypothetical protein YALI1_C24531g [Yarrowia lipolytica]
MHEVMSFGTAGPIKYLHISTSALASTHPLQKSPIHFSNHQPLSQVHLLSLVKLPQFHEAGSLQSDQFSRRALCSLVASLINRTSWNTS